MNSKQFEIQKSTFDRLVDDGVYTVDFEHAPAAKSFVRSVVQSVAPDLGGRVPLRVLDCGCGTGSWLSLISEELESAGHGNQQLYGFDLSEGMVKVAQQRLGDLAGPGNIRTGNALDRASYAFADVEAGFDVVFTYDVVQQLPRKRQLEACRIITGALAPGGVALIFDNDAETRFGRRMAWRKFLTRYCGLRLVPRYYCNAAYPRLEKLRRLIEADGNAESEILVRKDAVKRALVVRRRAQGAGETRGNTA